MHYDQPSPLHHYAIPPHPSQGGQIIPHPLFPLDFPPTSSKIFPLPPPYGFLPSAQNPFPLHVSGLPQYHFHRQHRMQHPEYSESGKSKRPSFQYLSPTSTTNKHFLDQGHVYASQPANRAYQSSSGGVLDYPNKSPHRVFPPTKIMTGPGAKLAESRPTTFLAPPAPPQPPRRKNATRETTNALKAWLIDHRKNPYPTKGEKIMLAIITKMTLTQVSTWFANARRRLKKDHKKLLDRTSTHSSSKQNAVGNEHNEEDLERDVEEDDFDAEEDLDLGSLNSLSQEVLGGGGYHSSTPVDKEDSRQLSNDSRSHKREARKRKSNEGEGDGVIKNIKPESQHIPIPLRDESQSSNLTSHSDTYLESSTKEYQNNGSVTKNKLQKIDNRINTLSSHHPHIYKFNDSFDAEDRKPPITDYEVSKTNPIPKTNITTRGRLSTKHNDDLHHSKRSCCDDIKGNSANIRKWLDTSISVPSIMPMSSYEPTYPTIPPFYLPTTYSSGEASQYMSSRFPPYPPYFGMMPGIHNHFGTDSDSRLNNTENYPPSFHQHMAAMAAFIPRIYYESYYYQQQQHQHQQYMQGNLQTLNAKVTSSSISATGKKESNAQVTPPVSITSLPSKPQNIVKIEEEYQQTTPSPNETNEYAVTAYPNISHNFKFAGTCPPPPILFPNFGTSSFVPPFHNRSGQETSKIHGPKTECKLDNEKSTGKKNLCYIDQPNLSPKLSDDLEIKTSDNDDSERYRETGRKRHLPNDDNSNQEIANLNTSDGKRFKGDTTFKSISTLSHQTDLLAKPPKAISPPYIGDSPKDESQHPKRCQSEGSEQNFNHKIQIAQNFVQAPEVQKNHTLAHKPPAPSFASESVLQPYSPNHKFSNEETVDRNRKNSDSKIYDYEGDSSCINIAAISGAPTNAKIWSMENIIK